MLNNACFIHSDNYTYVLIIQLIGSFTRVRKPVMPHMGIKPMTPVHVRAKDHTRQREAMMT